MEGYDAIKGWEGSAYKSGSPIYSNIYYEGIPIAFEWWCSNLFQHILCDELNALCAKFWWCQVGNEKKIHWKN